MIRYNKKKDKQSLERFQMVCSKKLNKAYS